GWEDSHRAPAASRGSVHFAAFSAAPDFGALGSSIVPAMRDLLPIAVHRWIVDEVSKISGPCERVAALRVGTPRHGGDSWTRRERATTERGDERTGSNVNAVGILF